MTLLVTFLLGALVAMTRGAVSPHIVGGDKATHGDHPYICSLQDLYNGIWYHVCGAIIWNEEYVATAAHCVDWSAPFRVQCGLHRLQGDDPGQVTHDVAFKILHENYNQGGNGYPNDIALLKLQTPLTLKTQYVDAYRFAKPEDGDFAGHTCTLSGWGLKEGLSRVNTLKKVDMKTISNDNCRYYWDPLWANSINFGHVCVLEHGKSSCNGDSGGPMRCGNVIVGITSWGINGCGTNYPSVYTRVSHFHNWLTDNAGEQPQ